MMGERKSDLREGQSIKGYYVELFCITTPQGVLCGMIPHIQ